MAPCPLTHYLLSCPASDRLRQRVGPLEDAAALVRQVQKNCPPAGANFHPAQSSSQVRVVHMVPPMLNFLTSSDQVTPADLESVRGAMCCRRSRAPHHRQAVQGEGSPPRHFPGRFASGFGMTETLGTHMTPLDDERLGYCGKVAPNVEAKVISEEGKALPEGERGELCIRSPSLADITRTQAATAPRWTPLMGDTGDVGIHK
ncbi:4-coumarate--CoA ligase [Chionoecetes opilio]|uniref:4-coumarate--CoA ligase n=1 Tax=Chionoecetes opilio TaxID=41210 RepID=A0A8J5D3N0_CHIOP|nr:4-coumarate--CoA ligase [Chionoecetes opilio]